MDNLKSKIIIVTGGSGLLGKEIMKNLQKKGATAINADISVDTNLDEFTLNFDITSRESILKGLKEVVDFY